ncbi:hypothetical protein Hanom_Chr17g01549061 [Helianthus anomalus]
MKEKPSDSQPATPTPVSPLSLSGAYSGDKPAAIGVSDDSRTPTPTTTLCFFSKHPSPSFFLLRFPGDCSAGADDADYRDGVDDAVR